jgi:hypothetical protein
MLNALKYAEIDESRRNEITSDRPDAAWYNIQMGKAYEATLDFLDENLDELRRISAMPEAERLTLAFAGNDLAKFTVTSRQNTLEVLAVPGRGWELARLSREEMDTADGGVELRNQTLNTVRRFWTEVHHIQTNFAPRGLSWKRDETFWRYTDEVVEH